MFNNFPASKFIIGIGPDINAISTDLNLSDTQKSQLNILISSTTNDVPNSSANLTLEQSIGTELKTATATTDKIKSILKNSSFYTSSVQDEELEKLVKIHDLLTAEQRKTFISKVSFGGGVVMPGVVDGSKTPVNQNTNDIPPGM